MMDTDRLIHEFRARQQTKKAESTAYDYSRTAREWAEWLEKPGKKAYDPNRQNRDGKTAWEADTHEIRMFLRQQLKNANISGLTIRNRRYALTAFYKELEEMAEEGYDIPHFENPEEDLDISDWQALKNGPKKARELKEEVTYLTPEEVDQLADHAPNPTLRNELIIRLLYHTGLRRGELARIRLQDLDTNKREIDVHANKTHAIRTVYYKSPLDVILKRWLNVERKALATADSEYLFPTYKTDRISSKQVNRTVRKAAEAAGLQEQAITNAAGHEHMKITAHVLRHTFAVQSVKNDMDTRRLQELMGHAKITTTERYLRFDGEDIRDAYRKHGPPTA